jgi:hypothetical protein
VWIFLLEHPQKAIKAISADWSVDFIFIYNPLAGDVLGDG